MNQESQKLKEKAGPLLNKQTKKQTTKQDKAKQETQTKIKKNQYLQNTNKQTKQIKSTATDPTTVRKNVEGNRTWKLN